MKGRFEIAGSIGLAVCASIFLFLQAVQAAEPLREARVAIPSIVIDFAGDLAGKKIGIGAVGGSDELATRLALSGFFDRYPNIKIIGAHVGGAVPFLAPRIERAFREGKSRYKPSQYFGKMFYDTSGPTHEAIIACVARVFGAEQIVFGTDYPFGLGQEGKQYVEHALGAVQESGLADSELKNIFSGNARKLLAIGDETIGE